MLVFLVPALQTAINAEGFIENKGDECQNKYNAAVKLSANYQKKCIVVSTAPIIPYQVELMVAVIQKSEHKGPDA